ncbi:MAG TPA: YciK family oxidoreductase [Sedimenticola thiotaurini]|uniref:YciK family oxidoreductase n=1 Tax=Sedimenticola thiotaurini TaxID=1543721 RepID=A0A831W9B3_9GAMM|nr:YciK family oxidoreductase [Sedimenticola thiotaurini]
MFDYQPATDLLADRHILVTGAAYGIGREAALAYARHGATVILLDRDVTGLESVYDAIEEEGSPQPAIYPMDLQGAREEDYQQLATTLEETFGPLHGLLHNAAQVRLLSRIDDYDAQTWFQVMQVNLNAPFLLTQACLPLLRRAGDAALLFTSDRVGRRAKAYWGAYAVSKFGIEGLMQVLAQELRNSPIRVNSIAPGPTRTNLRAHAYPGEDPQEVKPPATLMPLYLWLMGPESREIRGQALDAEALLQGEGG